ncbi:dihydrofolate reductase [Desulfomarina sp.]
MEIIIIAAMALNRIIGKNNTLPWHIPEELRLFKKTTMGCPMIMGRKTFESFPAPLPGRRHIVLSRNKNYVPGDVEKAESLEKAVKMCKGEEKVFIIGGAQVFRHGLDVATTIRLTTLEREVEGDVVFPELPEKDFREVSREHFSDGKEPFSVIIYRRNRD